MFSTSKSAQVTTVDSIVQWQRQKMYKMQNI